MAVLFYFERSWKNLKKIKSYTGIWNVEKVLYAINDFNLPFPVTFTQITWFVITEFIIILFGDIPPSLQNYIDYEAYGRDLDMGGCFIETSRGMCEIPY